MKITKGDFEMIDKVVGNIKGSKVVVWSENKPKFDLAREIMKEKLREKAANES